MARQRIDIMWRKRVYKTDEINVGAPVAMWRDGSGSFAPEIITMLLSDYLHVVQNCRLRPSEMNRTRITNRNRSTLVTPILPQGISSYIYGDIVGISDDAELIDQHGCYGLVPGKGHEASPDETAQTLGIPKKNITSTHDARTVCGPSNSF